jgi:hypothetical protein
MKTKLFLLVCLSLGIGLTQLFSQKTSKAEEFTNLEYPSPVVDKMNGKVEKVVLKFYWPVITGDKITKGKQITNRERDSLGWFYDYEAIFDKIGDHLIFYKTLDNDINPAFRYEFKRENGQIVSSRWTYAKERNVNGFKYPKGNGYSKFILDANGYLIGSEDFSTADNSLLYKFSSKNNEFGDEIEGKGFDNKGNLIQKWTNSYNDKRQLTEGNWSGSDGVIAGSYSNVYNDRGKASEVTSFDKDKKVKMVHYYSYPEYDAMGNWTQLVYKNSIGQSVLCERSITYFK